jgi:hypothetical protein
MRRSMGRFIVPSSSFRSARRSTSSRSTVTRKWSMRRAHGSMGNQYNAERVQIQHLPSLADHLRKLKLLFRIKSLVTTL